MKKSMTWYVVADGGKARFLAMQGGGMKTVQHFDESGHGDTDWDPSAGPSQLKAPRTDPHEQAKSAFAKLVAEKLNEAVRIGAVDDFMLAAPAHVLHDIRQGLDRAAAGKLTKSMSKDLTNTPDIEMAAHFG